MVLAVVLLGVNEDALSSGGAEVVEPPVLDRASVDGAGDRATGVDLGHHLVLPADGTVLGDLEVGVVGDSGAALTGHAVLALVLCGALQTVALGDVVLAGVGGDAVLLGASVDRAGVASVTSEGDAVHHRLCGKLHVRPSSLACNTQTVAQGRCGSKRPARTTVLRDVLVHRLRAPVHRLASVDTRVTPVPCIRGVNVSVRLGGGHVVLKVLLSRDPPVELRLCTKCKSDCQDGPHRVVRS